MDHRQSLGKRGEDLACAELEKRGYVILDRRFRTRCGELDIVARDGTVLVFIEVKARSGSNFGTPFESVTWKNGNASARWRHRICLSGGWRRSRAGSTLCPSSSSRART